FFDDVLSCVAEQLPVDLDCVASVGVSAGALFTAQLAGIRGDYLSSMVILSGGTGGGLIKPFPEGARSVPSVVLWGGETDQCVVIDFERTSRDLEVALTEAGAFVVECIHNCGHSVPPIESADLSRFSSLWDFVLSHPYWIPPNASPYADGLPEAFPEWC